MKYVCFSFDDARSDTFEYAFPILKKYGLKATVNVISKFIIEPESFNFISSPKPMTKTQLLTWQKEGFEIACHGATHKNTVDDILQNIKDLKSFDINVDNIGFASPESWITKKNLKSTGIDELKQQGLISYIRSGIQIKREGIFYICLSMFDQFIHNKYLYYYLNKRNIITINDIPNILPSAAIKDYTTGNQVQYIINNLKDDQAIILMFHSVLSPNDKSYGADHYYWSADRFDSLCKWLVNDKNVMVTTTYDFYNKFSK